VKSNSQRLTILDTTANINNMSSYFVGQYVTTAGNHIGYALSTTNRFYLPTSNGTSIFAGYAGVANAILLQPVNINRNLYELLSPSPNNSSVVQAFANDGEIQEVIGWQSNANRANIESNINTYWTIY
jgi:threonine synthase